MYIQTYHTIIPTLQRAHNNDNNGAAAAAPNHFDL